MITQTQRRRLERLERLLPATDFGARPGPPLPLEKQRAVLVMLLDANVQTLATPLGATLRSLMDMAERDT